MVSDSLEIYLKYKVVMGVDVGKIGKTSIQDDPMPAKGASLVALITDLAKVVEQISTRGFCKSTRDHKAVLGVQSSWEMCNCPPAYKFPVLVHRR